MLQGRWPRTCAKAGIEANVFMPMDTPESMKKECELYSAKVHLVDGLISDAARLLSTFKERDEMLFDLSTLREPYRVEGKKTMGYEIAEQSNWDNLPDVIVYPTGGGTGLIGMWKAFSEMIQLGWLREENKPRMVAVQSEGCAPVVEAFQKNLDSIKEPFPNAKTLATGLRVPFPHASEQIIRVIKESSEIAVAVKDDAILDALRNIARSEGLFVCPEGAATLAGLGQLIDSGWIDRNEKVLLYNTGSGLKYAEF